MKKRTDAKEVCDFGLCPLVLYYNTKMILMYFFYLLQLDRKQIEETRLVPDVVLGFFLFLFLLQTVIGLLLPWTVTASSSPHPHRERLYSWITMTI